MLNLLQSTYRASIVTYIVTYMYKKESTANAKLLVLFIHSFPFVIILNIQTRLIIQDENHAIMPPYRSRFREMQSQIMQVISSKLVHVFFHLLVSRAHVCPDFFLLPEVMQTMGEVGHLTPSTNNKSPSTAEPCL